MKTKIGTKIVIIFISFLLEIVSFMFLYFHILRQYDYYTQELQSGIKKLELTKKLERNLLQIMIPAESIATKEENFNRASGDIEDILNNLYTLEINKIKERQLLNYITEKYAEIKKLALKAFSISTPEQLQIQKTLITKMENISSNTLGIAEKFHGFIYEEINGLQTLQQRAKYSLYSVLSLAIILNILFVMAALIFFRNNVSLPLTSLRNTVLEIGSGNLDKKIEIKAKDEIGELAHAFNEMVKNLKGTQNKLIQSEKMASVGQLAAGVAHEIKNPLAIIIQGLEFLKSSTTDAQLVDALKRIIKATMHADRVVKDLLDFSHQTQPVLKETHIVSLIEETLSLVKYQVNIEHIQIKKEIAPDLPKVKIDRNQIKQVFINIIFNAIDAMPERGTITIKVREIKSPEARYIEIIFSDTGKGIPEEIMSKIFDPFFSTKKKKGSAGLGLAVSKSIIERHHGRIEIQSSPEGGTDVIIKLPVT